ncbi:retrovirus-related pol polyprotein from transposon TNT 1-94 [Tanacetum coccineum]
MVLRSILMKSGLVSVNTARQRVNTVKDINVNIVRPKAVVNAARPKAVVNVVKGNNINAVKASACWVWKSKTKVLDHVSKHNSASITLEKFDYGNPQMDLQDQRVVDSRCSRHMTWNMSYLTDFEEFDRGYVAFGGNLKRGKITGRGTIKTGNLDFENVYFVRELKFNLFSVSQICDKKNSVLFNDTECIVLSPNFKLTDESHVLLKVPRKNNMYSVDLKNVVPKGGLTCLFAKVTSDESKLWHRRLGHINFKTMNKLVKGNLVRGLPSKLLKLIKLVLLVKRESNIELLVSPKQKLALGFMRPFGCPVTILNTIDHLGKFNGKAAEGFFVGYSINSKAFRVFNSRTRIVKENLHVQFIVEGNQSNGNASTKASDDAGGDSSKEDERDDQEKDASVNSTNNVNAASKNEVNDVGRKASIELPDDPNMPALEDIVSSDDYKDVGAEAYMNNLDAFMPVSPISTTRVHKDHLVEQIIGDLNSAPQTRKMRKNLEEHGLFSTVQQRTNHKDLQNCLFACFLSQEEPKKVIHALKDPSWIEAMHEELLQFKLQEVWTLVDLPNGKRPIGTKWVFRNKKDERGIMIKNKARLMDVKSAFLYGKIEEGVYVYQPLGYEDPDFPDRVYKVEKTLYGLHQAHRAWYETLSTYLLDNGFQRGKIDKTLLIRRDKDDILLVQDQDKYVTEILKKFGFTDVKTTSTPMETQKPLLKDEDGEEIPSQPKNVTSSCCEKKISLVGSTTQEVAQFLWVLDWFSMAVQEADVVANSIIEAEYVVLLSCMQALVDGKEIIITEATVRRDLQLEDAEGIDYLPNATIFEQLSLIGYEKLSQKLTFYKAFFSPQWKFLIHTILQCLSAKTTAWNEFSSTMAYIIICLATNQKFNFSKYIFESMMKNLENVSDKFLMYPRFVQVFLDKQLEEMSTHKRIYVTPSHTKKIFRNMKRVGKGFSGRVTPLFPTMVVQDQEEMGKGSAIPTDPHHTPTITESTSQPPKKQRSRRPNKKDT